MKTKKHLTSLLSKTSVLVVLILAIGIMSSCEKESVNQIDNQQHEVSYKDAPQLPPYRFFVCGDPVPGSPYPCPNADCPYIGWDCLDEVIIYAIPHDSYVEYLQAANLLQGYIDNGNVESFFANQTSAIQTLIPSFTPPLNAVQQATLNDLQNGVTAVKLHPVYDSQSGREYYIIQIYVVATGDAPDYSHLL